jgi:hypothetical protein
MNIYNIQRGLIEENIEYGSCTLKPIRYILYDEGVYLLFFSSKVDIFFFISCSGDIL